MKKNVHICITESLCCAAEINTINRLYLINFKKILAMCFIQNSTIVIMMRSHIKMLFWLRQVFTAMHRLSLVAGQKLSCSEAYGILVPPPGIKPTSLALEGGF